MGDVISLAERRESHAPAALPPARLRGGRAAAPATFYFDLSCPFTYLALERAERSLGQVRWQPVAAGAGGLHPRWDDPGQAGVARDAAERRARELRIPLVWPAEHPRPARRAPRAATYAAEVGRGGEFALAAARLAFCGGFDVDDPEALAEAAAAAGLDLAGCLEAAADTGRDAALEHAVARLDAMGADRLPAIRIGRTLYAGEQGIAAAAAARRTPPRRRARTA